MRAPPLFATLGVVAVAGLVACLSTTTLTVEPSRPQPHVVVTADRAPVRLVLAPGVPNELTTPKTPLVDAVDVHGWRGTLEAGFHNAFPAPGSSGRTLEIDEAGLTFSGTAVGPHGTASVVATVHFKARVLDANGAELGALDGAAKAREDNTSVTSDGMTRNAQLAVEQLYETLAAKLIVGAGAGDTTPL